MENVLIINEDVEETNRIKSLFESVSSNVLLADSVPDALKYFINTELSLVILDATFSVEDDHKLLRAMRRAKRTPILVLSSKTDNNERLDSLKAGAHAYIGHPYTLEESLAKAQSLMQMYVE